MPKISIRQNVFETNSSSVHSFVYIPQEIAERWRAGEILIHFFENDDDDIIENVTDDNVIEMNSFDGGGIYPDDPYSYEGYFPYAMFTDDNVRRAWEDEGTLWSCGIEEFNNGDIEVNVTYMG